MLIHNNQVYRGSDPIKLKVNYDAADKVKAPNYTFFQAMLDASDLKDPKTLAVEFNSIYWVLQFHSHL